MRLASLTLLCSLSAWAQSDPSTCQSLQREVAQLRSQVADLQASVAQLKQGQQQRFWPLHDAFFANQRAPEDADIEAQARLAQRFGARGTPSFFINGRVLVGAHPQPRFEELIDAERAKAKASGIPRSSDYRKAVLEEGQPSAP